MFFMENNMGVGTMRMIGGTFNKGHVIYSTHNNTIKITPESLFSFSDKKFTFSDVVHFEEINVSTSSGLAKAGTGAAAGYLLAGPLAGLAGMALGGAGGTSNKFTLGFEFKNGDAIMVVVSPTEFMELKSLFGSRSKKSAPQKEKKSIDDSKSKINSNDPNTLKVIKGREGKPPPDINTKLSKKIHELGNWKKRKPDDISIFYRELFIKIRSINEYKWLYFDKIFNDKDIGLAVALAIIEYMRISELKPVRRSKEEIEFATKNLPVYRKEALRYVSQKELTEDIEKYKDIGYKYKNHYKCVWDTLQDIIFERINNNDLKPEKLDTSFKTNKTKKNENNDEISDRLHKLQSLLDKNIISKEEYETQRQKIISEI